MTRTSFSKRHSLSLGALAALAIAVTSGCHFQEAGASSSWAMNADDSATNTMSTAAYGEARQELRSGIDLSVQKIAVEEPNFPGLVTYGDAVSKFGMTVNEDAFGSYMGEGLIGFRWGLSGIFWGMVDSVPTDD